MIELQVPAGALVLVGDGRKALFLRNKGAPTHVELIVERVLQHADARTRDQGTDRPGRYQDRPERDCMRLSRRAPPFFRLAAPARDPQDRRA